MADSFHDGKISAIDAQSGVMPATENSTDARQGFGLHRRLWSRIFWTPRKPPDNRTGISPAHLF